MDPNDESNQLGWHAVSSSMPIVIEDAFEPPPAHSRPRPAVQQHRSVRPLVQHGSPFENSENYREAELPRAPMLALPDCRHHLAAECDATLSHDHSYSSLSNYTSSSPTTPSGEIVPSSTSIGEQDHAQNSDSVTSPLFPLLSLQLIECIEGRTRQVSEQPLPQQPSVTPKNTYLDSRSLRELLSSPPQTRSFEQLGSRARRMENVRRNIGIELQVLAPSAQPPKLNSPSDQFVETTPFCSTPRKRYSNGVNLPDSSSCPASPMGSLTNADRQPAGEPRQCHTAPLDQHLSTPDEKQTQGVQSAMEAHAARRDYVARQPRLRFPRKTEPRAARKRTAARDDGSHVMSRATNGKQSVHRTVSLRPDWEQSLPMLADISSLLDSEERSILQPAHLQMLQDTAAQSGALAAAVAQLDRTAPQMMQLMLGIGRTWEAVQEAWSSFEKVSTCFRELQGPLEAVGSALKEAQRLQTSNANNNLGNIPHQGTPDQNAKNCQRSRAHANDGELTLNYSPTHVTGLNLSAESNIFATYAAADMQISISQYKADIAKVRESLGGQSSQSSSDSSIASDITDTEIRGAPPAPALTDCAAAKQQCQKPATGIAMIAQPRRTEVKLLSSVLSLDDKMRNLESREWHPWSYGEPAPSKKPTSKQLPHSLDKHGGSSNVRVRARKEKTASRYWKVATASSASARSRSTTNLRSRTSFTTRTPENILENHPHVDRLLRSSASSTEQSKISPVQERTKYQEMNFCGISPPYEKTGGSFEGGSRPLTTETTSQFETTERLAKTTKSRLVTPHSTEVTMQCPTTAEGTRSRSSDFSTARVEHNVKALLADAQKLSRQNVETLLSRSMVPYWTLTRWMNEYYPRRTLLCGQPTEEHVDRSVRTRGALTFESGDKRDSQRPYAMEAAGIPAPLVAPPEVRQSISRNPGDMCLMSEESFDGAQVPYSHLRDQPTVATKLEVSNSSQLIESSIKEAREASEKHNTASIAPLSALKEDEAAKSAPTATRDVPVDEKAFEHACKSFQEPVNTQMQNGRQRGHNEDMCTLRCNERDPSEET